VPVTAGQSSVVDKQYDNAAAPTMTLAPGSPSATMFPSNLTVTYAPQGDPYTTPVTVTKSAGVATTSVPLFPFASGYQVFAGTYATVGSLGQQPICLSVDPAQWVIPNAAGHVGARQDPVSVLPGSTGTVPMPLVTVTTSSKWLVAVSAVSSSSAVPGDPGCATGMRLNFAQSAGNAATIALPYGTWQLYALSNQGDALTTSALVDQSKLALPAGSPPFTSSTIFTLDPRAP
jgi:hypothetical protein